VTKSDVDSYFFYSLSYSSEDFARRSISYLYLMDSNNKEVDSLLAGGSLRSVQEPSSSSGRPNMTLYAALLGVLFCLLFSAFNATQVSSLTDI